MEKEKDIWEILEESWPGPVISRAELKKKFRRPLALRHNEKFRFSWAWG